MVVVSTTLCMSSCGAGEAGRWGFGLSVYLINGQSGEKFGSYRGLIGALPKEENPSAATHVQFTSIVLGPSTRLRSPN